LRGEDEPVAQAQLNASINDLRPVCGFLWIRRTNGVGRGLRIGLHGSLEAALPKEVRVMGTPMTPTCPPYASSRSDRPTFAHWTAAAGLARPSLVIRAARPCPRSA